MTERLETLSRTARQAIAQRNGSVLQASFSEILQIDPKSAEGHFLKGIFFKVQRKTVEAVQAFEAALKRKTGRYDAAVEWAEMLAAQQKNQQAKDLIETSRKDMSGSPLYLNMAGEIYTRMGLHDLAFPLFEAANAIQKDADVIESNLAASAAKAGEYEIAREYYTKLLEASPNHQRHHFELSRLITAKDETHVQQMEATLNRAGEPGPQNIFLYFALAKEYEDLGHWEQAAKYLSLGNQFAAKQSATAGYDVAQDINLLTAIRETCTKAWVNESRGESLGDDAPIFITGLPRTGTTLVERIIGAHSKVESVGESFFLDTAIKRAAAQAQAREVTPDIIRRAAQGSAAEILADYLLGVNYRRTGSSHFIEKLPLNFLNIGFILKAMPRARIIILDRKPMDACFAMFKQPYFRFSYDLDGLGEYYRAFHALRSHWLNIAPDRLTVISYENLVHDPDRHIREILSNLGLDVEQACLDFHLSKAASATASFAQIRQKAHTGSVNKWLHFESLLSPVSKALSQSGIDITPFMVST